MEIVAIGWPIAVAGIVFAIVYVGLGRILTSIDPIALTAMGLGQQFENIPYTVTDAGVGASTLVGQWIGARNATRARASCWSACQISMIALLPFAFIFIGFAPQFIGLLTSDPIVACAGAYMYWNFPIVSFMALECAVEGAFNGTGITYPVIIIALMLNLTRLPMAAALARRTASTASGSPSSPRKSSNPSSRRSGFAASSTASSPTSIVRFRPQLATNIVHHSSSSIAYLIPPRVPKAPTEPPLPIQPPETSTLTRRLSTYHVRATHRQRDHSHRPVRASPLARDLLSRALRTDARHGQEIISTDTSAAAAVRITKPSRSETPCT